jgi:hypothetical protein
MNEILIESLVGSVEDLQKKTEEIEGKIKGLQDHSEPIKTLERRLGTAEKEIQDLPGKIFMPLPEILNLTHTLQQHSRLLGLPMKQEVRHEHHINKSVIVTVVLSLIVIGLLFLIYYAWFEADQHKDNDIKFRYLRVFEDSQGLTALRKIDSEYSADPAAFRQLVIRQEKIDLEKFEDYQQMQKNQQEIKNLQEKWKQQPDRKSK